MLIEFDTISFDPAKWADLYKRFAAVLARLGKEVPFTVTQKQNGKTTIDIACDDDLVRRTGLDKYVTQIRGRIVSTSGAVNFASPQSASKISATFDVPASASYTFPSGLYEVLGIFSGKHTPDKSGVHIDLEILARGATRIKFSYYDLPDGSITLKLKREMTRFDAVQVA